MNHKRIMRSILMAVVALSPLCALAASYSSHSNPVGEKAYVTHSLMILLPLGIIVGGLLLTWLLARIQRRTRKEAADSAESHHG